MGGPGFFALFGVPFVLIGLYFVFGRFLVDLVVRKSTRYELTDKRIIIERSGWFSKTITLSLPDIQPIELRERASGRGTIVFGSNQNLTWLTFQGIHAWTPSLSDIPQFLNIDRAADVFATIEREVYRYWEARQ